MIYDFMGKHAMLDKMHELCKLNFLKRGRIWSHVPRPDWDIWRITRFWKGITQCSSLFAARSPVNGTIRDMGNKLRQSVFTLGWGKCNLICKVQIIQWNSKFLNLKYSLQYDEVCLKFMKQFVAELC